MSIWFQNKKHDLEALNQFCAKTAIENCGIKLTAIGEDYLEGTMPVDHRTVQPFKVLHGGATALLAESLGSIAANLVIDSSLYRAVGQSIQTHHLLPTLQDYVIGVASPVHLGRRSHLWRIEIFHPDRKRIVSHSMLTMAILPQQELANQP
jgi:1,4-dihydroxy-2-naphthoyl-CoA hydrolase